MVTAKQLRRILAPVAVALNQKTCHQTMVAVVVELGAFATPSSRIPLQLGQPY
jgi:hypothetical protein